MVFSKDWYRKNKHPKGMLGKKHTKETKTNFSKQRSGKKLTEEHKKKISKSHLGKKLSRKTKSKISKTRKENYAKGKIKLRCGKNNNLWNGGKSSQNKILRNRKEYKRWREKVFKRDNYTCQNCGVRSKKNMNVILQAHHIIPIAVNMFKIYDVDNGITFCKECHELTDSYLNNKINKK